jgi:C4-dicarboxylate-binding protein DctP
MFLMPSWNIKQIRQAFCICLLIFCWPCVPISMAFADPVVIRIWSQSPAAFPSNHTLLDFKGHVEAKSAGELRVEIDESPKLFSDQSVIDGLRDGKIDMGFIVLSRYAGRIPALDLFQLPFLFNKSAVAAAAVERGSVIRKLMDAEILKQQNGRVLWWVLLGHSLLLADHSLADPSKLAGKRVRTYGPMMESLVVRCGGEPKDIGGPEQEKAYEAKTVDIGMTNIATYMDRKLWRLMKTVTRTNHAVIVQLGVMNETFYQKLSERHKAIVQSAAEATDQSAVRSAIETDRKAYQRLIDDRLAAVAPLTSEQVQLWRFCSSDVLTDYAAQAGELGEALIRAYGRLREQPCCDKPDQ